MKKITVFLISIFFFLSFNNITYATIDTEEAKIKQSDKTIIYPKWANFEKLKKLIDNYFSKKPYWYQCLNNWTLCPNPKYTSVTEKQLKLIIASTYKRNEIFYSKLLPNLENSYFWSQQQNVRLTLFEALNRVPKATNNSFIWGKIWNSYIGDLLESSFWIDFSDKSDSNGLLSAIKQKIEELKRKKCTTLNSWNYQACPYSKELSNIYLPTLRELFQEKVYLNGKEQKISVLNRDFTYTIINSKNGVEIPESSKLNDIKKQINLQSNNLVKYSTGWINNLEFYNNTIKDLYSVHNIISLFNISKSLKNRHSEIISNDELRYILTPLELVINEYIKHLESNAPTYTLEYKKMAFTFEETVEELEKTTNSDNINWGTWDDKTKNKNYKALMKLEKPKNIPEIFKFIPKDAVFSYIKNPQSLLDILNNNSKTVSKISWIDVNSEIKKLLQHFFDIEDFSKIENNLNNEMVIALMNIDYTSPEIVLIISEKDKEALSSSKTLSISSKNWYIFISPSKKLIERFTELDSDQSIYASSDLEYVWWKKWSSVKDMFIFAWDAFFEKMTEFDNYVLHFRKYTDYTRLKNLQELVWAYIDFTGNNPKNLQEVITYLSKFQKNTIPQDSLDDYSLEWDIVINKNIGSLKSLNTISESDYNLENITRNEIESYKYSILKYRDVWRANLDPMWIVINKFGDWIEVDFFMTPIPFLDWELGDMLNIFKNITKNKLDFVENPKVRAWLFSIVYWFDPAKLKNQIPAKSNFIRELNSFNKDIMDWKNILDYLWWELALSIWSIDNDILEWWNIDKLDAYVSVQLTNEEKWKELVEILRKRLTSKYELRASDKTLSKAFSMLAKPLIEEYKDNKIYFVSDIPLPFFWKWTITYAYVNNFLVISTNKSTIKKIIDSSISWDIWKSYIIDSNTSWTWTFLSLLFDWVNISKQVSTIIKDSPSFSSSLNRYLKIENNEFEYLLPLYYKKSELDNRLGKNEYKFKYIYWFTTLANNEWNIYAKIDETKLNNISEEDKKKWNSIKSNIAPEFFTWNWQDITLLFNSEIFNDFQDFTSNFIIKSMFNSSESLLRNFTFTMNLWDDIVWYKLRIFRDNWRIIWWNKISWFTTLILISLLLIIFIIVAIILRSRIKNTNITKGSENIKPIIVSEPISIFSNDLSITKQNDTQEKKQSEILTENPFKLVPIEQDETKKQDLIDQGSIIKEWKTYNQTDINIPKNPIKIVPPNLNILNNLPKTVPVSLDIKLENNQNEPQKVDEPKTANFSETISKTVSVSSQPTIQPKAENIIPQTSVNIINLNSNISPKTTTDSKEAIKQSEVQKTPWSINTNPFELLSKPAPIISHSVNQSKEESQVTEKHNKNEENSFNTFDLSPKLENTTSQNSIIDNKQDMQKSIDKTDTNPFELLSKPITIWGHQTAQPKAEKTLQETSITPDKQEIQKFKDSETINPFELLSKDWQASWVIPQPKTNSKVLDTLNQPQTYPIPYNPEQEPDIIRFLD